VDLFQCQLLKKVKITSSIYITILTKIQMRPESTVKLMLLKPKSVSIHGIIRGDAIHCSLIPGTAHGAHKVMCLQEMSVSPDLIHSNADHFNPAGLLKKVTLQANLRKGINFNP